MSYLVCHPLHPEQKQVLEPSFRLRSRSLRCTNGHQVKHNATNRQSLSPLPALSLFFPFPSHMTAASRSKALTMLPRSVPSGVAWNTGNPQVLVHGLSLVKRFTCVAICAVISTLIRSKSCQTIYLCPNVCCHSNTDCFPDVKQAGGTVPW